MRNRWNAVGMLLSFPIGTFRCSGFLYQQNQNIHIFKVPTQYYIDPTLILRNLIVEGLDFQHCMYKFCFVSYKRETCLGFFHNKRNIKYHWKPNGS